MDVPFRLFFLGGGQIKVSCLKVCKIIWVVCNKIKSEPAVKRSRFGSRQQGGH